MSQTIDNQIVKMQFDNASFEQNVKQSMSTLDKLKAALKFEKVDMTPLQKAFNETEATATKAGFSIRDVWLKVATEIENQVANKIVESGKKIMNALTFEGVLDGFKEYELKMGSIQTIMNGTGESLATVNRYLDELNTYSDKTIYSFADMTQNIGKFTNNGVKLKDAVADIKGIANWAADAGANTAQMSHAMYNLSQALSSGFVKLIDWKSIENANMATQEFKNLTLEMAVALGNAKKEADGMYKILTTNSKGKVMADLVSSTKNFNDSLQYQWMTTDVLNMALKVYSTNVNELSQTERDAYEEQLRALHLTKDQIDYLEKLGIRAAKAATEIKTFSMLMDTLKEAIGSGWAQTWQIIIGDLDQAKALWTAVGDTLGGVISKMSDARNEFLKAGLQTGWEEFINLPGKAIPETERFRDVLVDLAKEHGVLTNEQWKQINSTDTLMDSFHKLGWVTGDLLVEAVDDYATTLNNMTKEERESIGITDEQMKQLEELRKGLKNGILDADEFAKKMVELGGRENILQGLANMYHALVDVLKPVKQAFDEVFGVMDPQKLFDMTVRFREFTEQLKVSEDAANTIRTAFTLAFKGVKAALDGIGTAVKGVSKLILPMLNLFDALFGLIGKVVSAITGSNGAVDAANKLGRIGDKIGSTYLSAMQKLADWIDRVANAIRNIPESPVFARIHDDVIKAVTALQQMWTEFTQLPIIQQMVADFWATIDSIEAKITPVVNSVNKAFEDMYKTVESKMTWQTVNDTLTKVYDKVKKAIDVIKDVTQRIKDFFKGLKDGKTIVESFQENFGDVIDKIKELKENLDEFFTNLFQKGDELGTKFNLDEIAQAIHNFVANITPEQVTMLAVAGTFSLIAINMLRLSDAVREAVESFTSIGKALKNVINSYVKKQKSVILQIAESIVIVAAALWMLSTIPKDDLEASIGAIETITVCLGVLTVVLGAVGKALSSIGGGKAMVEMASGLALVAGSIFIVTGAMKLLETVNLDGIYTKLVVLGTIMVLLVGLSALMGKLDKFNKGSLTMIAAAASLFIAAASLQKLSEIDTSKIKTSMEGMLEIMLGLAAIVFASSKIGVFSAVGLIGVVLTMERLLPAIENIVNYDYDKIQDGLEKNHDVLTKVAILAGAMTLIGAIAGNRLKGAGVALLSMSATFAILLGVAKLAGMMDARELAKGEEFLWSMAALIAVLEICSNKARIGMFGGKNGGEGSKMFTRIAVAMGIMLGIAKLASMMETKDLVKGAIAVAALEVLVLGMVEVAKHSQKSEGMIKSVSGMIFAISVVLAEVAVLSMIPLGNMVPALTAVIAVIAALALLAAAINSNKPALESVGLNISRVVGLIAGMVAVIAAGVIMIALSKQPIQNVAAAAGAMVAVIGALTVFSKALNSFNGEKSGARTQAVIGALVSVAVVGAVLGALTWAMQRYDLNPDVMLKAAASIAVVLVGITPALAALSKFDKGKVDYAGCAKAVGLAVVALVSVAGSIGLLSQFGGENIMEAGISLAIGLVAVSIPMAILGVVGAKCQQIDAKAMGDVVKSTIAVLVGVGLAIGLLSQFGNPETMIQSAQALAIGLVAISVPITVLGVVGTLCRNADIGAMYGTVGAAILALAGISIILIALANGLDENSYKKIDAVMPSLILAVAAVGALAIAISAAGLLAGGNVAVVGAGAAAIVLALAGFGLIVAAIGALGYELDKHKKWYDYIVDGLDMLVVIAGKLGEAAGAFIGGFGAGITSQLDPIADNLNKFSAKMITFSENMAKVNKEAVTGAKNLAAAMLYICAAEFVEGITRWLGLGNPKFDFEPLGKAVAAFCEAIKDIPQDAVTKASACSVIAKRLAEMTSSIQAEGGVAQWLLGEKDLGKFAENVKKFGEAIKAFSDSVQGLPQNAPELAKLAADTAVPMVDLTRTLVADDGILQRIIGHKNLGEFGERLEDFARGLKRFIGILNGIEQITPNYPELIAKCTSATKQLVELSNSLENMGGLAAGIFGDNTLKQFGDSLVAFGESLGKYTEAIASVDFALVESANATIRELVDLGKFASGVSADSFAGLKFALEDAAQMPVSAMANEITVSTPQLITAVTNMFTQLTSTVTSRKSSDKPTYLAYGRELVLGVRQGIMDNYQPQVIPALTAMIDRVKSYLNTNMAVTKWLMYGKYLTTGIKNGITNSVIDVINALNSMVLAVRNKLSNEMAQDKFNRYGENICMGIAQGVRMTSSQAYDAAYRCGMYIAQGLAEGINNHADEAVDAARDMVDRVNAEIEKVEKINSPSKVTYKYGMYIAQGLANGVEDYSGEAVDSTGTMAEEMISAANQIINSINDLISGNIDAQPVIRPVLDTSDVESQAKHIGSLFSRDDLALAYTAYGSINEISKAKAEASQIQVTAGNSANGLAAPLTINMTINAAEGMDEKALAEYVKDDVVNELYRKGAVFA